ncbi:MAG: ABC transporter substrate-binding protein [Candidatus Thorarchaeota archaeon]
MKKRGIDSRLIVLIITLGFILLIFIGLKVFCSPVFEKDSNRLVIYHWWTSSGEKMALNSLVEVFTQEYPEVIVALTPISGGAGYQMFDIIKPLVRSGEAPDAFQMHAGYEAKPYYDAGLLEQVNYIWESEELENVVPKIVQIMCQFDGNYYSVPIDIHRANVVWYNKILLDEHNIDASDLTDWDSFFKACDNLKANGVKYPIQIGKDWTVAHVFETIMAGEGIEFYEDWINGKITSPDDPRLLNALEIFKKYVSYTNPDYTTLEWDIATSRIISGESAFNIMGDWANGEFKIAKKVYNEDYGTFKVPNTNNMYGLVIDTFQHPKAIANPENSDKWLKVVSSNKGQDAFNPIKGSISARVDTDVSKYDLYSRLAILDFISVRYMFPSVVHGSGAPEEFKIKFKEIMSDFVINLNVTETAVELTDYSKEISDKYTIGWDLD